MWRQQRRQDGGAHAVDDLRSKHVCTEFVQVHVVAAASSRRMICAGAHRDVDLATVRDRGVYNSESGEEVLCDPLWWEEDGLCFAGILRVR